jgi:hypothetical protein
MRRSYHEAATRPGGIEQASFSALWYDRYGQIMGMVIIHIRAPSEAASAGEGAPAVMPLTACESTTVESIRSFATVTEALEAAAVMDGQVCRGCLKAHGFDTGAAADEADGQAEPTSRRSSAIYVGADIASKPEKPN